MRRSGKLRLSNGRVEVALHLRRRLLRRTPGRRGGAVGPVVPGLECRLDEWRQVHRLLRSSVTAVSVAAEATPGPTAVPTAHRLGRHVTAPAALASQDRQAESEPAQHRELPVSFFCVVVHFVLLLRLDSLLPFILARTCEPAVKDWGTSRARELRAFTTDSCQKRLAESTRPEPAVVGPGDHCRRHRR